MGNTQRGVLKQGTILNLTFCEVTLTFIRTSARLCVAVNSFVIKSLSRAVRRIGFKTGSGVWIPKRDLEGTVIAVSHGHVVQYFRLACVYMLNTFSA